VAAGQPFLSCVLIFLDSGPFIDEAVRSVVGLDGSGDWELLLIDDGSTDASTKIARRWAEKDPRVTYLDHAGHANLGMSASRNAGIAAARGRYIAFLDADDAWLPCLLEHYRRTVAAHPDADVVVGGTIRWHGWTGESPDRAADHLMKLPAAPPGEVIESPALLSAIYGEPGAWRVPAMCSLLIERRALLAVGGMEQQFRGLYEDQVLYTKLAASLRAVIDPRPVALYRQHATSAVTAAGLPVDRRSEAEERFLEWARDYVAATCGEASAALEVVQRNLEYHGAVRPSESSPWWRRRVLWPAKWWAARVLRGDVLPSIEATWSEQFLRPALASARGRIALVGNAAGGETWSSDVPRDAMPAGATVCRVPWSGESTPLVDRCEHVVVQVAVSRAASPVAVAARARELLAPGGRCWLVFPGPAHPAGLVESPPVGSHALAAILRDHFPGAGVTIESFGNAATARGVEVGSPAVHVNVVDLNRHDPAVPVMLAVTVSDDASGSG
jgi:GT2 family glycosyltransferase